MGFYYVLTIGVYKSFSTGKDLLGSSHVSLLVEMVEQFPEIYFLRKVVWLLLR
jgi:hypothetical protein